MKFYLCQTVDLTKADKNTKELKKYGEKSVVVSEHASQHALDLAFNKCKKQRIFKVIVPELYIGYKIYNQNGEFFGEVVKENVNYWIVKRPKDVTDIDCMLLKKDHVEQKYINQNFIIMEENE
jgi:hypothetical protein